MFPFSDSFLIHVDPFADFVGKLGTGVAPPYSARKEVGMAN